MEKAQQVLEFRRIQEVLTGVDLFLNHSQIDRVCVFVVCISVYVCVTYRYRVRARRRG